MTVCVCSCLRDLLWLSGLYLRKGMNAYLLNVVNKSCSPYFGPYFSRYLSCFIDLQRYVVLETKANSMERQSVALLMTKLL